MMSITKLIRGRNGMHWLGSAGTECGWYGVTCNAAQDSVVGLSLSGNQLSGSIPSTLGNPTNLRRLRLNLFRIRPSDEKSQIGICVLRQIKITLEGRSG